MSRVAFFTLFAFALFFVQVFAAPAPITDTTDVAERDVNLVERGYKYNKFGALTYFWQNGAEGACGHKHPDSFPLVALMGGMWSESNCGQVVNVCSVNNRGYCVKAVVADACIGDEEDCPIEIDGRVHMDASAGLFEAFAPLSEGVVDVYLETNVNIWT